VDDGDVDRGARVVRRGLEEESELQPAAGHRGDRRRRLRAAARRVSLCRVHGRCPPARWPCGWVPLRAAGSTAAGPRPAKPRPALPRTVHDVHIYLRRIARRSHLEQAMRKPPHRHPEGCWRCTATNKPRGAANHAAAMPGPRVHAPSRPTCVPVARKAGRSHGSGNGIAHARVPAAAAVTGRGRERQETHAQGQLRCGDLKALSAGASVLGGHTCSVARAAGQGTAASRRRPPTQPSPAWCTRSLNRHRQAIRVSRAALEGRLLRPDTTGASAITCPK
jgi:hypothetical protein